MFRDTRLVVLMPLLVFGLLIGLWESLVNVLDVKEYILPSPTDIFLAFSREVVFHGAITLIEAAVGFMLAAIFSFALAVMFIHIDAFKVGFFPFVVALKTTPIIAIAPILLLWFGTGMASKVVAAAIVSFFPILITSIKGLSDLTEGQLLLFRSLGASRWQLLCKLRFPQALPYVFSGLKASSALAVVGATVGEFVGARSGLGYYILIKSVNYQYAQVYAALFVSTIVGLLLFGIVAICERLVLGGSDPQATTDNLF